MELAALSSTPMQRPVGWTADGGGCLRVRGGAEGPVWSVGEDGRIAGAGAGEPRDAVAAHG